MKANTIQNRFRAGTLTKSESIKYLKKP